MACLVPLQTGGRYICETGRDAGSLSCQMALEQSPSLAGPLRHDGHLTKCHDSSRDGGQNGSLRLHAQPASTFQQNWTRQSAPRPTPHQVTNVFSECCWTPCANCPGLVAVLCSCRTPSSAPLVKPKRRSICMAILILASLQTLSMQ